MADTKITALTALTAADPANDVIPIVDVSDTSMAASGTTKKISVNNILGASGTATLASATITGDLTAARLIVTGGTIPTNGLWLPTTNTLEFAANSLAQYRIAPLGVFSWYDGAGGTRMTLNSTGLGVGASPSTRLHISNTGDVYARIATTSVAKAGVQLSANGSLRSVLLYDDNAGTTYLSSGATFGGSAQALTLQSGTSFQVYTNNQLATAQMTLDASGNLLVGTTSAGGNRLNVQTASGDCLMLVKSQAANTNLVIDYVSNYGNYTIRKSGTAVWDYGVISDSSATPTFKIQNASSVGVQLVSGATAWTTLSDETVKDIIEPISNAVAKVGSLRSVIGKFKTDDSSKRRSFLIAQDVQSVLPEAVDVIGENNELGLRYTEVIPLLVAAIKELTARVQTLEAR
jgi:hypothetical protein